MDLNLNPIKYTVPLSIQVSNMASHGAARPLVFRPPVFRRPSASLNADPSKDGFGPSKDAGVKRRYPSF